MGDHTTAHLSLQLGGLQPLWEEQSFFMKMDIYTFIFASMKWLVLAKVLLQI